MAKAVRSLAAALIAALAVVVVPLDAPPVVANDPSLTITIENLAPITIDFYSASPQYLVFNQDADRSKIDFTISTSGTFQASLYRYLDAPGVAPTDNFYNLPGGIYSLQTGEVGTDCDPTNGIQRFDPYCNTFRLDIDAYAPGNIGNYVTVELMLIRNAFTNVQVGPVTVIWDNEGELNEVATDTYLSGAGWYQLPVQVPNGVAGPGEQYRITKYTRQVNPPVDYNPGTYLPIFSDATFSTTYALLNPRPTMQIFGEPFVFANCSADPADTCLTVDGSEYESVNGIFYVNLETDKSLTDHTDDNQQTGSVSWGLGRNQQTMPGTAEISSIDFRRANFAQVSDGLSVNGTLSDSFLCPEGICHEVWKVSLFNNHITTQVFDFDVYFIINPDPAEQFTLAVADDEGATPAPSFQSVRMWRNFPNQNNYSKAGFAFGGWSSTATLAPPISLAYYPVLQNDIIYPYWLEQFTVRFFNGNTLLTSTPAAISDGQDLSDFQVTLPGGSPPLLGWALTPRGATLDDDYVIYEDMDVYAVWDVPSAVPQSDYPVLEIFSQYLTFDECPGTSQICLTHDSVVHEKVEDSFYVVVETDASIASATDDATQTFDVIWRTHNNQLLEGDFELGSLDFRHEDFNEIWDGSDERRILTDSFLCPQGTCHLVWFVEITADNPDGSEFSATVNFILDTTINENVTTDVAEDSNSNPPYSTYAGIHEWLTFPPLNVFTRTGYLNIGWTSTNNNSDELLPNGMNMFPVLSSDRLYPNWQPSYSVSFYDGQNLLQSFITYGTNIREDFSPTLPSDGRTLIGWSLTPGGQAVGASHLITQQVSFYALWQAAPAPNPPANNPPSATPTPQPTVVPEAPKPTSKTTVQITRANGITKVLATIPSKYVNKPSRLEVRRIVGGKVRYYLVGRAWTHFNKTTPDKTKAQMVFSFKLELKPTDVFRVKVSGTQVIRSTGDGKPAWK